MLDLLAVYEEYLKAEKHASENTISSYSRDVRQFAHMKTRTGGEEKEKEINRRIEIKTVTREEKEMVQLDQVVIPLCG